MIIGTVTGTIHSTINHPFYDSRKLLLVEREDEAGSRTGAYTIAVDVVDAGIGERVLVSEEGNAARQIFNSPYGPVRSVVIGVVDHVNRG